MNERQRIYLDVMKELSDHLATPGSPQASIEVFVQGVSIGVAGPGEIQLCGRFFDA